MGLIQRQIIPAPVRWQSRNTPWSAHLDSHDLDAVVAEFPDAGNHVVAELEVRVHLGLLGAHADVALIDAQAARALRPGVLEDVLLLRVKHAGLAFLLWLVVHAVEEDLVPLLRRPLGPRGDALGPRPVRELHPRLQLRPARHIPVTAVPLLQAHVLHRGR